MESSKAVESYSTIRPFGNRGVPPPMGGLMVGVYVCIVDWPLIDPFAQKP